MDSAITQETSFMYIQNNNGIKYRTLKISTCKISLNKHIVNVIKNNVAYPQSKKRDHLIDFIFQIIIDKHGNSHLTEKCTFSK